MKELVTDRVGTVIFFRNNIFYYCFFFEKTIEMERTSFYTRNVYLSLLEKPPIPIRICAKLNVHAILLLLLNKKKVFR